MRVDLGEGRWAELHDRITHRMFLAMEKASFDSHRGIENGEYPESFSTSVILTMTREWSLGELTRATLEEADYKLVDDLYAACDEAYRKGIAEIVIPPGSKAPSEKSPSVTSQGSTTRT